MSERKKGNKRGDTWKGMLVFGCDALLGFAFLILIHDSAFLLMGVFAVSREKSDFSSLLKHVMCRPWKQGYCDMNFA
jgi:hypothetical protein